ncbi:MAG: hypothetical protein DRQ41_05785, partial [Gammaproteobacteria bacterium]
GDYWKLIDLGEDSTLVIKGGIVEIRANSLHSKEGAKIKYDNTNSIIFEKLLTLVVVDGSGIDALSIIGTGRDGKPGSNGGRGSRGDNAYTTYHLLGPKCHSAKYGGAGGNGIEGDDGESGMSIIVSIKNLNPKAFINIVSNGGNGGRGGNGGNGGNGGDGNTLCTNGKAGGVGGDGGDGGDGGNGGAIKTKLTYSNDATQEDINEGLNRLKVTANLGNGNDGGTEGKHGSHGSHGFFGGDGYIRTEGDDRNGANGSDGASGDHKRLQVPPRAPSVLTPKDKSNDIDPTKDLEVTWKASTDSNGDSVTYDVYLWEISGEEPNELTVPVCSDVSSLATCTISSDKLDYGKIYYWQVDAKDGQVDDLWGYKNITTGGSWRFSTLINQPPSELINPALVNGDNPIEFPFKDVLPTLPITLSWEGGDDPDSEDVVTHTIKFLKECSAITCEETDLATNKMCTIPADSLGTGQPCFWEIQAKDDYGNEIRSKSWNFTTLPNQPPSAPINLVLTNEGKILTAEDKVNPNQDVVFSWDASDDPEGDEITYHLYVQKEGENPILYQTTEISQVSDKLEFGSYEWWVVAKDTSENAAESDKMSFETLEAPSNVVLTANSGYANTLLDWDTDATGIIKYRVLRVLHPEGTETAPEFGVDDEITKTADLQYTDADESLEGRYCYRVEGLDENGDIVSSSVYDQRKNCVTDGEVTLVIESISGTTTGEVPIEMPNGGNLQISTADICFKYDPDVLQVTDVTTTAFSNEYAFNWDANTFSDLGILKIQVEANEGGFGDAPVMGPGALADVSFAVKEERGGKDSSELSWFEASENEDLVNQPEYEGLKNCIIVRDNNNLPVEPLGLRNGSFTVRKGSRDGKATTQARFYVREAYSKGDVDGDGIVSTADARMATGIGVGYYPMTQDQLNAADFNSDNQINAADAIIISHYALHQEWLDNDKPEGSKTRRGQRDGKDTPITFRIGEISSDSGSEIKTTLSVDNLTDMTAMNLAIAYDTAVVEKAKVKKAGLAADASLLYYDNKKGTVRIGLNSEQPINGSGVIAEITLTLASGGSVKSTPLVIAKTNLYDKFSRNFVTSALQRQIAKQNGKIVLTDVEETVIKRNGVEIPIEDIITVKPPKTDHIYSISGRFTDTNGKPIADVVITVGDKTVVTDNAGYYAVVGLTEGEYQVTARKSSDDSLVYVEKTCVVGDNESCRFDFVAETRAKDDEKVIGKYAVHGIVLDRDLYPIKGATVKVGDKITTTNEMGYFAFVGLSEGEYSATVRKGTEEIAAGSCVVAEGSNCQLNFNTHFEQSPPEIDDAKAIYGVQITVKDELKQPIAGVVLQLGGYTITTDEEGYGEFIKLTEGKYTLTASKEGMAFSPQEIELGNEQLWTKLLINPLTDQLKTSIVPSVWENAEQGKHFTYIITVLNGGNETATGVSFEYQLPTGTDLIEIRGEGACESVTDDNTMTCTLPDLLLGAKAEVEIELSIVQPVSRLTNVVTLTSNEYPADVVRQSTIVKPYLSVFCKATPNPITTGSMLHYECDIELNDNAPSVATEIELEMQLPHGVEVESLEIDNGTCDTSNMSTVTCKIIDLSLENVDDISHVMVGIDVALKDAGLLMLITEAKVTANEYPAHTNRVRTKVSIPPEYQVDLAIVIDVTGSMQQEMNGTKKALKEFITDIEPSQVPLTALVVFGDEVTVKAVTTDLSLVEIAINKMKASGGGTCPEASIEALDVAITHVKKGGTIFFVTDASPYEDADVIGISERMGAKEIILNTIITGDCTNQDSWNVLP